MKVFFHFVKITNLLYWLERLTFFKKEPVNSWNCFQKKNKKHALNHIDIKDLWIKKFFIIFIIILSL